MTDPKPSEEQIYEVIYYNPSRNHLKIITFQLQNVVECGEWILINKLMDKMGYENVGEV